MHDVAIVGGGPGGLYLAQLLASANLDVVLFEEHATSGEPVHCTGVIAREAFEEFTLPREAVLNPLSTVRFFSPAGRTVEYTPPAVEALAIDRVVFDRMLSAWAVRAGASIVVGQRVTDVAIHPGGARLTVGDGTVRAARACVLACGANYTLQRRLGLGMPSVFVQSAQSELPVRQMRDVEVYFGRTVAPNGFAWVVPVERASGSFARIGLMCDGDSAEPFRRFLARVAEQWGVAVPREAAANPRRKS